jgi:hypothetical protein
MFHLPAQVKNRCIIKHNNRGNILIVCSAWVLPQLLVDPRKAAAALASGSSTRSSGCAPHPTTLP